MAKKKKPAENPTDDKKITEWLKNNSVTQIDRNVQGPVIVKSFFRRKRKPQDKPEEKIFTKE